MKVISTHPYWIQGAVPSNTTLQIKDQKLICESRVCESHSLCLVINIGTRVPSLDLKKCCSVMKSSPANPAT